MKIQDFSATAEEAERAVLGALLLDNGAEIAGLTAEDFGNNRHRLLFTTIQDLLTRGEIADLITVKSELEHSGRLQMVGGAGMISALTSEVPTAANSIYYARLVQEAAERHRFVSAHRCAVEAAERGEDLETIRAKFTRAAEQSRNGHLPPIKPANEILNGEYPPPRYLVEGVVPDTGVVLLAGKKAVGKTQAALSMAAGIATGGYALGRLRCERASVLYIQLELSERRIHERLRRMRIDSLDGLDFGSDWPVGIQAVEAIERAVKRDGYGAVFVDVLQKIWPQGRDVNHYGDAYNSMGPLRELANRLCIAIIVCTHTRKATGEDILDSVMGSTGITGNADVVAIIDTTRGTGEGSLSVHGNDVQSMEVAMRFDHDTTEWIITDADPLEIQQTPERRAIIDYLREHGPSSTGEIAEHLQKTVQATSNLLRKMTELGLILQTSYGSYAIDRVDTQHEGDVSSVSDVTTGAALTHSVPVAGEVTPDTPVTLPAVDVTTGSSDASTRSAAEAPSAMTDSASALTV